jgi:DNA-directed RNA polymerase subunit M/transcription elongation factor TFIIS
MAILKIVNPDDFRANIVKKINNVLNNEKNSGNLEKGIYNYTLKEATQKKIIKKWDNKYFVQIYLDHLRSIMNNLNEDILKQINNGSMKPHLVAFMTHQELCPEKWSQLIEAKTKRDMNKYETQISAATDTFTCRKCKSSKCTYYLQQCKSADEPMTCFVTCIVCENRWKC